MSYHFRCYMCQRIVLEFWFLEMNLTQNVVYDNEEGRRVMDLACHTSFTSKQNVMRCLESWDLVVSMWMSSFIVWFSSFLMAFPRLPCICCSATSDPFGTINVFWKLFSYFHRNRGVSELVFTTVEAEPFLEAKPLSEKSTLLLLCRPHSTAGLEGTFGFSCPP